MSPQSETSPLSRFLVLAGVVAAAALAVAAPAAAKEIRQPLGTFGGAAQPSFVEPKGLAVDQSSGDVYVIDGRNERQSITVSATAGNFKLRYGAGERELKFNASSEEVDAALEEIACSGCIFAGGGPGDATGSHPYEVLFARGLASTDVEQVVCESGSPSLSGGSGCSVETTTEGANGGISRWHADGTPADFSALGTNVIDGKGPGEDETPQDGLLLGGGARFSQVAVDSSGGATDGDIYIVGSESRVVDIFSPSGTHLGQITKYKSELAAEEASTPLSFPCGVAVDEAGDVYVSDLNVSQIHKYEPAASPVVNNDNAANFTASFPCALAAGAGSTAGSIFSVGFGNGEVFKLDSTTGEQQYPLAIQENSGRLERATGVAVDPANGHVLPGRNSEVLEYDASGPTPSLPRYTLPLASKFLSLAVGGTGTLYLIREGSSHLEAYSPLVVVPDLTAETASEATGTTATLNATISAAGGASATCHFEYTTEAAYLADKAISGHDGFAGAQSAPCEPAGPFTGTATSAVSGKATGLTLATSYRFRIVGENANGKDTALGSFETAGAPLVEGGSAAEITDTTAKVSGKVNPHGLPTSFAAQYVTEAGFNESGYASAITAPAQSAGSAFGFGAVAQQISGLSPSTTYHFRLTATNEGGSAAPGPDGTFTTFTTPAGLPDGRAYEQVSPTFKLGEVFPPDPFRGTCTACVPGFEPQKVRMPMQSTPDGSTMTYEGSPFSPGLVSGSNEYLAKRGAGGWQTSALTGGTYEEGTFKAFSTDLSRAVLRQVEPVLSEDAPAREGKGFANLYLWKADGSLRPLLTTEPPHRSPGRLPGGIEPGNNKFDVNFGGANAGTASTPAFSHVAFQANDALTAEAPGIAPEAPAVGEDDASIYEWSEGELRLVSVLPGNGQAAANAVVGSGRLLVEGGGDNVNFDHAISNDGSRIFWSEKPSGQVFVREDGTTTTEIPDPGKFLTATPSGSKVLLSDGKIYDLETESLGDLTGGQGGFEGILGAGEDLSRVYFVDTKALTPPGEENANGEHAEDGKFNLYLGEEGTTTFIGRLLGQDDEGHPFVEIGTWHAAPGNRTAQASADGRYLAFQSRASLTGYDNRFREAKSGAEGCLYPLHQSTDQRCPQVFEYDAVKGTLSCPSCNPSGQRPLGMSYLSRIFAGPPENSFPQPHNLPPQGEGRLFFDSQDALSPADANGPIQDVYEWEPAGVGSCQLSGGCLSLISSGHSPKDSQFVNATPSGSDAFFTTREALVAFDRDDLMDLYDARVGGGFPFSAEEPCRGEACKGASSVAPEQEGPGTAGFSEAAAAPKPACKKGAVKKRGRCVQKKKKHNHKRAAKHNQGGAR